MLSSRPCDQPLLGSWRRGCEGGGGRGQRLQGAGPLWTSQTSEEAPGASAKPGLGAARPGARGWPDGEGKAGSGAGKVVPALGPDTCEDAEA